MGKAIAALLGSLASFPCGLKIGISSIDQGLSIGVGISPGRASADQLGSTRPVGRADNVSEGTSLVYPAQAGAAAAVGEGIARRRHDPEPGTPDVELEHG